MLQILKDRAILLVLSLGLILIVFSSVAFASSEKIVYVTYNTTTTQYITAESTVEEFLQMENITIESDYTIDVNLTDKLSSEEDNYIKIVTPVEVYFSIDEVATSTTVDGDMTTQQFISELEQQNNQVYSVVDEYPEYVSDVTSLALYTDSTQQFISTQIVPFETEYVDNPNLPIGTENVVKTGAYGEEQVVIEATFEGGVETSRTTISDTIITEPTTQVVERGTLVPKNTSYNDSDAPYNTTGTVAGYNYSSKMTMHATAYTSGYESTGKNVGDPGYGVTATGMEAQHGVVAVDPNVIPLGTHLYIPGYGEAIAADTGGAIKGNSIDLYFDTVDEALAFGRRDIEVYILE